MELKKKVVLLTGVTSGIGRELAKKLSVRKASLAICGRSEEKLAALVAEVEKLDCPALFARAFDITNEEALVRFYHEVTTTLGCPDIVINNAGANTEKAPIGGIRTEVLDYQYALNMRAPLVLMREAFNSMKERKSGHIVNVLSSACLFSNENIGAYSATKAGLDSLTKILRKEARPFNIKVTAIYPGGVNTEFRANPRPDYMSAESTAEAIMSILTLPDDVIPHELVFRPAVESNF